MTMVDIQGLEDFFGDMDFKVGGTHKGITAIQVDIKIDGLTMDIIAEAFEKTEKARNYILDDIMLKAIPAPRDRCFQVRAQDDHPPPSPPIRSAKSSAPAARSSRKSAPSATSRSTSSDDGKVFVSGRRSWTTADRAMYIVETIAKDPEVGAIYKGRVTRLMNFGAFVEIAPGKEGLVHISKLENHRVEKVEDVVQPSATKCTSKSPRSTTRDASTSPEKTP